MTLPAIAFSAGLTAWTHLATGPRYRIELASSAQDAPLFLAAKGDRIRWVQDRAAAETFVTADAAWDHVVSECLTDIVRVRS